MADNPAIGAEQRMLKLFEFYILNFDKFRLLRQLASEVIFDLGGQKSFWEKNADIIKEVARKRVM